MPDTKKNLVIAGRPELLIEVSWFCREVYHRAFGTEEGELRVSQLPLIDAVSLWQAGLPHSRQSSQPLYLN
jgi:hypothetical protein